MRCINQLTHLLTYFIQQDLRSNNLSLNEAIDAAQNRPLWRLMSTFGATQSAVLVVHARKEEKEECMLTVDC